jgi:hypothetical protein
MPGAFNPRCSAGGEFGFQAVEDGDEAMHRR